jgi:hypothetical protein
MLGVMSTWSSELDSRLNLPTTCARQERKGSEVSKPWSRLRARARWSGRGEYAPPGRRGRWRRRRRGARGGCGGRPRAGRRRGGGGRAALGGAAAAASAGATPARTGTRGSRRRTAPPLKPGRIRPYHESQPLARAHLICSSSRCRCSVAARITGSSFLPETNETKKNQAIKLIASGGVVECSAHSRSTTTPDDDEADRTGRAS